MLRTITVGWPKFTEDIDVKRPGWRGFLPRRVRGHRDKMLTVLGIAWVSIGLYSLAPESGVDVLTVERLIPLDVRAGLWVLTGLIAIAISWRPPGYCDTPGWVALYLMPPVRVVAYSVTWVAEVFGGHARFHETLDGLYWIVAYAMVIAVVYICSGWPDAPRDVIKRAKRRGHDGDD